MAHRFQLTAAAGRLRWGYYDAATLTGCVVAPLDAGGWTLSASVAHVDRFRLSQQPIRFVVNVGAAVWAWPVIDLLLDATGTTLSARLGLRERLNNGAAVRSP